MLGTGHLLNETMAKVNFNTFLKLEVTERGGWEGLKGHILLITAMHNGFTMLGNAQVLFR